MNADQKVDLKFWILEYEKRGMGDELIALRV